MEQPQADQSHAITPVSLLERARQHDEEAWGRLLSLYQPLVLSWCRRSGVSGQDGEDVSQEVFASVARALSHFHRDRPGDSFRSWLRAITHNAILLYHRRNRGRATAEGGSDALNYLQTVPDPLAGSAEDDQDEISQVYRRALEQVRGGFEEHSWQAFWLTTIEARSPAALAAELNMTPDAIRQAKARVLRRLREELGELLD